MMLSKTGNGSRSFFDRVRSIGRRALLSSAAFGLSGVGLVGCVGQPEYDQLYEANRALESRNQELTSQLDALTGEIGSFRGSGNEASETIGQLRQDNAAMRQRLAQAAASIGDLEDRLSMMDVGRLDPATDLALSRLAAQYPEFIVYDSDLGRLRFASDLTFRSGSDEVQAGAKRTLGALEQVLNARDAQAYDVRVVGHTDSQPLSSGTRQRFGSNVGLSVMRAIAVRAELRGQGVDASRMQAAGWGEHRPAVANTSSGNTPQNRRVEIYLVPSSRNTALQGAAAPSGNAPDDRTPASQPVRVDPTK